MQKNLDIIETLESEQKQIEETLDLLNKEITSLEENIKKLSKNELKYLKSLGIIDDLKRMIIEVKENFDYKALKEAINKLKETIKNPLFETIKNEIEKIFHFLNVHFSETSLENRIWKPLKEKTEIELTELREKLIELNSKIQNTFTPFQKVCLRSELYENLDMLTNAKQLTLFIEKLEEKNKKYKILSELLIEFELEYFLKEKIGVFCSVDIPTLEQLVKKFEEIKELQESVKSVLQNIVNKNLSFLSIIKNSFELDEEDPKSIVNLLKNTEMIAKNLREVKEIFERCSLFVNYKKLLDISDNEIRHLLKDLTKKILRISKVQELVRVINESKEKFGQIVNQRKYEYKRLHAILINIRELIDKNEEIKKDIDREISLEQYNPELFDTDIIYALTTLEKIREQNDVIKKTLIEKRIFSEKAIDLLERFSKEGKLVITPNEIELFDTLKELAKYYSFEVVKRE